MSFTLREVPKTYRRLKELAALEDEAIDLVVMHQANQFMLDALVKKLGVAPEKVPYFFEHVGNTVSSTIPLVLEELARTGKLQSGTSIALLGFGVGLSWAGAIVRF